MGPVGYLKYSGTPTRVTRCSAALLDHVFVTHPERIIETLFPIDGLSDHYPICFVHKARVPKSPKSHNDTVKYQSFKNLDKDRSIYDLNNAPWSLLDIFENVDDKLDTWELTQHTPILRKEWKGKSCHFGWMALSWSLRARDKLAKQISLRALRISGPSC